MIIKVESESSDAERQHHPSLHVSVSQSSMQWLSASASYSLMHWLSFSESVIKAESETEKIAQHINSINNADQILEEHTSHILDVKECW